MKLLNTPARNEEDKKLQGRILYPDNNEIFNRYTVEKNIISEDFSGINESNKNDEAVASNRIVSHECLPGRNLIISFSKLEDEQGIFGSEDDDINYYNLGEKIITNWIMIKENNKLSKFHRYTRVVNIYKNRTSK